jgi:hypothetical protein
MGTHASVSFKFVRTIVTSNGGRNHKKNEKGRWPIKSYQKKQNEHD